MRTMIVGTQQGFANGVDPGKTKDDIKDLAAGAITIAREDNNVLVHFASATRVFDTPLGADTKLKFVQGTGAAPRYSPVINPKTLVWTKQVYAAPVAKVVTLGRNAGGTIANWNLPTIDASHVGKVASIRISDLSKPLEQLNAHTSVEQTIVQGDTSGSVHTKLLAKLQKLQGKFYATVTGNISGTNYGFTFTGIVGKNFIVKAELLLAGSTIAIPTPFNGGRGLAKDLAVDEKNYATELGYNPADSTPNEMNGHDFFINPATTYDVFTLNWTNPQTTVALAQGDDPMLQTLLICVPTGGLTTISADVQRALEAISGGGANSIVWRTV
jgi:hypothetical protein